MCLVVLAWQVDRDRPLLLVANRDEMHARPTEPMAWWPAPRLLAGRDLVAGGTWLGVADRGRFGLVTNVRGAAAPAAAPSRGTLVPRFLAGTLSPTTFLESLAGEAGDYAGFNLLLGDDRELAYLTNADRRGPRLLAAGIHGMSNGPLDAAWPKVRRSCERLAAQLSTAQRDAEELLEVLADRTPAADVELPDTGVGLATERLLSAAFIVAPRYGTRSTSVLVLGRDAGAALERTHRADGAVLGTRRFELPGRG